MAISATFTPFLKEAALSKILKIKISNVGKEDFILK